MSYSESDTYTIERISFSDHFLMTPNSLWEDESISFQAKGLLGYLLSRPKNWKVNPWHLSEIYKGDRRGNGLDGIKAMIKELRTAGYITYSKSHGEKGLWIHKYKVYPMPQKDFQKIYPEMVKPPLVEPAEVKPSILTSTELTNTEQLSVCTVPEAPAVRLCEKEDHLGNKIKITRDDLFTRCVQENKQWSNPEIEEAWVILCKYSHPVNDWFNFIEGTIKKLRIKKNNSQHKEKTCKKDLDNTKILKTPSERRKDFYSANDTSERPLAVLARQLGLK